MQFDIFFSISQTPVAGRLPSEREMFANFFAEVAAADALGFGVAWVAESHLSSQVQKESRQPVIPHWQGEVGLNVDITQLAHQVFARTRRIEVGSAVTNILCNGGPIAAAERLAYFAALHGVDAKESRRLHVGFSAGRFDFMNRAYGIDGRDAVERAAWPTVKGLVFREACEIFLRLLAGEALSSDDIAVQLLTRDHLRDPRDWDALDVAGDVPVAKRWCFEKLKVVPQEFRRELLQLVIGSHDASLQEAVNSLAPVQVFNLSITKPEIVEDTHRRMQRAYHASGGPWQRGYMPRTTFVFLNEEDGLDPKQRSARAHAEAHAALSAYWTALEGTLDSRKVAQAADNALVGNADEIVMQAQARFHPHDRLMLWFDFFNHDSARVIRNMRRFMERVAPAL
jgi:alkanesulfonate monooxygenase SsuD/methylene tetrahydromethanopterin reductase-like flavin-dependent oxidoreductase (luciferase family)